ncbi:hypothetical protein FACS189411_09900 [Bacteroidia bacterium]|nr:hypothetical protein FACS189411_09900 [Bacteroidia bacterium]
MPIVQKHNYLNYTNMENLSFVALDIETATSDRSSICELGITIVENSQIKESHSWLIRPPENKYDGFNIYIHGITPNMTKHSPEFPEIWETIKSYLQGKIVVAHNTGFDMYALRDAFNIFNIEYPEFQFFCSYKVSSYVIEGAYSYSLPKICDYVGIEMSEHHRAEADSKACANLFIQCINISKVESLSELEIKYFFKRGYFKNDSFSSHHSTYSNTKAKNIVGHKDLIDEDSIFYDKNICFTGTMKHIERQRAKQMVADIGGIPQDSVTQKTDILIVGQQDYRKVGETGMSSKQRKAIELIGKGQKIDIMSEEDFLQNISFESIPS